MTFDLKEVKKSYKVGVGLGEFTKSKSFVREDISWNEFSNIKKKCSKAKRQKAIAGYDFELDEIKPNIYNVRVFLWYN